MSKTIHHMSIDVRGVLGWKDRDLRNLFCEKGTGAKLTAAEVREYLLDKLEKGHRVLPMGKPCKGWSKKSGCPGHKEEPPTS